MTTKSLRTWVIRVFETDEPDFAGRFAVQIVGKDTPLEYADVAVGVREGVSLHVIEAAIQKLYEVLRVASSGTRAPTVEEVDLFASAEPNAPEAG